MGRKQNAVVLAYFDRGEKCDKISNRYQYTCRVCAEGFDKGRLETLIAHITGICPGLTPAQRDQIYQLNSDPNGHQLLIDAHEAHEKAIQSGLTGLEALAEASRQVDGSVAGSDSVDPAHRSYESILENDLATFLGQRSHPRTPPTQSLSTLAGLASYLGWPSPEEPDSPHENGANNSTTNGHQSPNLPEPTSLQLHQVNGQTLPASPRITSMYDGGVGPLRSSPSNSNGSPRSQRIRGRFSDERREQVKHIRSKGACIRCRMLRKTCSAGDPCSTCCNIETARVWKTPCMRTKLSKVFGLYSAEPWGVIASVRMQQASALYSPTEERLSLSFQFAGDPLNSINVDCLATTLNQPNAPDGHPLVQYSLPEDSSWQAIGDDLDALLQRSTVRIHDYEEYEVVKSSLKQAEKMRHNEEDTLVAQALHLWDLTHLLTSPEQHWKISKLGHASPQGSSPSTPRNAVNEKLSEDSTSLLHCQLLALASQQASRVFTSVVNILENSLIRRTTYRFSHFIAVILLLACVERMDAWISSTSNSETIGDLYPRQWPLAEPPSSYTQEAETFVDLVSTLLRVRSVPPKIVINPVGILEPKPKKPSQVLEESAIRWFDRLEMSLAFLNQRKDAPYCIGDFRSLEMKYCSRFLLVCLEEQ